MSESEHTGTGARPTYARPQERSTPLSLKTKLLYAWGEMPGSHMNFAIGVFLLLYYNQILGVSATAVSLAMGAALLLDAVSDPLVGAFSDQFKSKLGRRHPFMYLAAVPLGVVIYLLFTPPSGLSEGLLIAWLVTFLILTRLIFTVFSVPWSALLPELASKLEDRTSLAAYRPLVASVAGGIFGMLVFRMVFPASEAYPQGQLNPANYTWFGALIGGLITLWCLVTTHFTRREIPYLLQPADDARPSLRRMLREVVAALSSRNYRLLLGTLMCFLAIASTLAQFDMLVNTYFWQLSAEQLSTLALFAITGPVLGFIVAPRLQPYVQKHHIVCTALLAQMLISLLSVGARLGGVFPANDSSLFLPLLACITALSAFIQVISTIAIYSMYADLVDEQEYRVGYRQEGVFASGIALATKLIGSVGVIVAGLLLDHFIGLTPGQGAQEIPDDVIVRLAITDAVIVNAFILIPAFLISRYNLRSERAAELQALLTARRKLEIRETP